MHFAYLQEPRSWYEHSPEVLREGGKEDIYSCLFLKFLLFLGHVDKVESIQLNIFVLFLNSHVLFVTLSGSR